MNPTPVKPPSQYFGKLQNILSEITGIDPEDITFAMEFDELSMNPVELAEFLSRVNRDMEIRLKSAQLEDFPTVGLLSEYIEDELE
ncbi:MAG: acyl carrier protein [Candidatus Woesebacteria bacterium]